MAGGEQTGDNNPKGFNECVSQEQLQAVVEDAQKRISLHLFLRLRGLN